MLLKFNGKAVRVGEAKRLIGATLAEKSDLARSAKDVQETLDPTENRDEYRWEKKGIWEFPPEAGVFFEHGRESADGNDEANNNAGGEGGAQGIIRPEEWDDQIKRKDSEDERFLEA